jgi:hypothetical protein
MPTSLPQIFAAKKKLIRSNLIAAETATPLKSTENNSEKSSHNRAALKGDMTAVPSPANRSADRRNGSADRKIKRIGSSERVGPATPGQIEVRDLCIIVHLKKVQHILR